MRNPLRRLAAVAALLVAALTLGGCPSTWSYRSVQDRFEVAARTENQGLIAPLVDSYSGVAADLTDEKIKELDPRLHANAYMMRAVCEWRSGEYSSAIESSRAGLDIIKRTPTLTGSRDHVVLKLVQAVVIFDQTMHIRGALSPKLSFKDYLPLKDDLESAWDAFDEAQAVTDRSRTPVSIGYYVSYQRWRMLQGWHTVVNSLDPKEKVSNPDDSTTQDLAKLVALDALGAHLSKFVDERDTKGALIEQSSSGWGKAVEIARDSIPEGEPLRELIRTQSK